MAKKKGLEVYADRLRKKSAYSGGRTMVNVMSLFGVLTGGALLFMGVTGEMDKEVVPMGLVFLFSSALSYFLGQAFFDIADAKLAEMEKEQFAESRARVAANSM